MLKNQFDAAMDSVVQACRKELAQRGYTGDPSKFIRGEIQRERFWLYINETATKPFFGDTLVRIGRYSVHIKDGPDVLHVRGEGGQWWTSNFAAMRDEFNQKLLSPENQITFNFDQH